jgi:hypothetical protein
MRTSALCTTNWARALPEQHYREHAALLLLLIAAHRRCIEYIKVGTFSGLDVAIGNWANGYNLKTLNPPEDGAYFYAFRGHVKDNKICQLQVVWANRE